MLGGHADAGIDIDIAVGLILKERTPKEGSAVVIENGDIIKPRGRPAAEPNICVTSMRHMRAGMNDLAKRVDDGHMQATFGGGMMEGDGACGGVGGEGDGRSLCWMLYGEGWVIVFVVVEVSGVIFYPPGIKP